MKRIIIVSALALAACGKPAEQASPAGQETAARRQTAAGKAVPAPPLALEKIIRGELKAVKNWEDLKGKAVVLEFWGIYCQPCVENIPHLNELAEKFRDKQVVFISLTRDKQGNVEKFLKEHEMKGNVAVEAGAAFRSFRVNGIPHTVLVDKDGLIKAVTYPSRVTESVIEALLAGGPVPGDNAAEAAAWVPAPGGKNFASFSVSSYDGAAGKTHMQTGDAEFSYEGGTLASAISKLMETAVEYKGVDQKLLDGRYTINCRILMISGADNKARLREMAVAGLNGAFPFTIRTVRENRKTLVLKKAAGAAGPARAAKIAGGKTKTSDRAVEISARGYHVGQLQKFLQNWLKTPVLDETGLKGVFDYDFATSSKDLKIVNIELKKIGLKLEEGRREVEIALVTGIPPGQGQ